jgi:hypothetical protein
MKKMKGLLFPFLPKQNILIYQKPYQTNHSILPNLVSNEFFSWKKFKKYEVERFACQSGMRSNFFQLINVPTLVYSLTSMCDSICWREVQVGIQRVTSPALS